MNNKMSIPLSIFTREFLNNSYTQNMFKADGSFNPKYNSFKKLVLSLLFLKIIGLLFILIIKTL